MRAIGLPSASVITSVELTVSGPGMNTISIVYDSLPSSIEIAIPSGRDRTFELVVFVDVPIIAATSYKGTATADLTQNSATIYLTMGVGSTKIVVPDYSNNRVIQFDDINDSIPMTLDAGMLFDNGLTTSLFPYDVDFDREGRIYIANVAANGLIRVDNISGTDPVVIGTINFIYSLAIDRQNNLIYYYDGSILYQSELDGSGSIQLTLDNHPDNPYQIMDINGLSVDDKGILYIAGAANTEGDAVFRYNPDTQEVTAKYDDMTYLSSPWDAMVKDDKLYITNPYGDDGYQILELSTSDLSLTNNYGNPIPSSTINTSKGMFYGPRRFAAPLNEVLTIIDDYSGDDFDKIIQMDNINGDNWKTLPASGNGQNLFKFFDTGA